MEQLFTSESLISFVILVILEVVLGIDNVIFVSIVMSRLRKEDAKKAGLIWMGAGIIMRITLLFVLLFLIKGEKELFMLGKHSVSLKDIIALAGGLFLLVNSTLEIHNKVEGANEEGEVARANLRKGFRAIMTQIILIDLVFSMDGIVTAIGMARQLPVMATAVIISMIVMFYYAPKISGFINKHPTFKILALSFLVLIAVLLVVEGIHVEKIHIPKGYIYFAMAFSFAVELLNLRFRKKTNPVQLRKNTLDDEDEKRD